MHPEIDRFAHLDSPLHRWDPRWKIPALFFLMLAFGFTGDQSRLHPRLRADLPPALAGLAVSLALVELSRIPVAFALRSLRAVLFFMGFFLVILPFTHPEDRVAFGPLELSTTGFLTALLIALRGLAIMLLLFPMFGTSRFDESMRALQSLKVPARLVQLVVFTYRYIFVFMDEARRLQIAWKARGFFKRCRLHTLRTIGNGVGMLVVGSLERSQRIYQAMKCRGYTASFRILEERRARAGDVAKALLIAGLAAVFFLGRVW